MSYYNIELSSSSIPEGAEQILDLLRDKKVTIAGDIPQLCLLKSLEEKGKYIINHKHLKGNHKSIRIILPYNNTLAEDKFSILKRGEEIIGITEETRKEYGKF